MAGALEDELLALLADVCGSPVRYAERPQRLTGGFFTENWSFTPTGAGAVLDRPLVVRLFPGSAPADLAGREAMMQSVLSARGFPAPRVVVPPGGLLDDRRFFIMERLPGRSMIGGVRARDLARAIRWIGPRMATTTARVQAELHRVDPGDLGTQAPVIDFGVDRWFGLLTDRCASTGGALRQAAEWLAADAPAPRATEVICHGDLWGGNILVEGKRVTGVIDYTVATVAEPALDVGFTTMALGLAPVGAPEPVQRLVSRVGSRLAARYLGEYRRLANVDLANVRYYEALRCAIELIAVLEHRLGIVDLDRPPPTWNGIGATMVEYFRDRTGVTIELPPLRR